jgi:hypothetical protein
MHTSGFVCCAAGDVVWQAVLSLVLMNPNKGKGGKKVGKCTALYATAAHASCCWMG